MCQMAVLTLMVFLHTKFHSVFLGLTSDGFLKYLGVTTDKTTEGDFSYLHLC